MKGFTLWFTGPDRSDRNYLARMVEESLLERGIKVELLAEESAGMTLFGGLDESKEGRETAAERAAYVSELLARNDVIAIASVDCPRNEIRDAAREALGKKFCEVYAKGAAAEGFEEPAKPEVLVSMEDDGEDACVSTIIRTLEVLKLIPADEASGVYSDDEEEKITKRLKDLGYI
jgi:adenylylsulfate kinase-like enzyme